MKKILIGLSFLLLSSSLFAQQGFSPRAYSFDQVVQDAKGSTFTVVYTFWVNADSATVNYLLTVRGLNVYDKLTMMNGATTFADNFAFQTNDGKFYGGAIRYIPQSVLNGTNVYTDIPTMYFYDGAGNIRNELANTVLSSSVTIMTIGNIGGLTKQDRLDLLGYFIDFKVGYSSGGVGSELPMVVVSSGGWYADATGKQYFYRSGLECATTIYAQGIEAFYARISTITGNSPVFMESGIRLPDGTILISTGGYANWSTVVSTTDFEAYKYKIAEDTTTEQQDRVSSDNDIWESTPTFGQPIRSSTARIPTVYVCASDSPQELRDIAHYVCDGTNDETELQSALDYVNGLGGGKVQLERGTYNVQSVEGLYISSNTTLSGQGFNTIIDNTYSGSPHCLYIRDGAENVVIEYLYSGISASSLGGGNIYSDGKINNITVDHVKTYQSNGTAGGTRPIWFGGTSSNVWITNNILYGSQNEIIKIDNGFDYHINNNSILSKITTASSSEYGIRLSNVKKSAISDNTIQFRYYCLSADANCIDLTIANNVAYSNEVNPNSSTGFQIDASSSVISGNSARRCDKGFNIGGSYNTITGNSSLNSITYNASIGGTNRIQEGNSWNANSLFSDGSNPMTGALDMGNNNINNCPVIMTSTSDVAGLKISTSEIQGQIAVIVSTDGVQWTMIYQQASTDTALWDAYINNASTDTTQWTWLLQMASSITVQWSNYYIAVSTDLAQWTQINKNTGDIATLYLSTSNMAKTNANNYFSAFQNFQGIRISSICIDSPIIDIAGQGTYDITTSTRQFCVGVDSVPAVTDFMFLPNLSISAWNLISLCGFIDTPPTGTPLIADVFLSNNGTVLATINIPVSCSSGTIVNISSSVASGVGLKARIKQVGSTIAGSDFRINGRYFVNRGK